MESGSESNMSNDSRGISSKCPMENVSSTFQSLDTVRALHQTVVSLRSALEEAKFEIQRLRNQISAQTDIKERNNSKIIEVNSELNEKQQQQYQQHQQQQHTKQHFSKSSSKDKFSKVKTDEFLKKEKFTEQKQEEKKQQKRKYHHHSYFKHPEFKDIFIASPSSLHSACDSARHHYRHRHHLKSISSDKSESRKFLDDIESDNIIDQHNIVITPDITVVTHPNQNTKIIDDKLVGNNSSVYTSDKMASKIDVKIKVTSNIKVDGTSTDSSTTTDIDNNDSGNNPESDGKTKKSTTMTMNNENNDNNTKTSTWSSKGSKTKFHLQSKSEDKYNIRKDDDGEYVITQQSKENLNIEDSENSQSEGDNSVFMEDYDEQKPSSFVEADTSKNSNICTDEQIKNSPNKPLRRINVSEVESSDKEHENKEEFDDIELIFSSEETRDPIQEDMVSILEYDPWQQPGNSGTPVLVKFSSLPSTDENDTMKKLTRLEKGKLSSSTTYDVFLESDSTTVSDSAMMQQQKSIDNSDSLDVRTSTKSSSLEKDNSGSEDHKDEIRPLDRDESFDFFNSELGGSTGSNRKWTNYKVLVETDISKCGIVEETTTFEMYRRNTCPNPPAYRSLALRDGIYNARHIPSRLTSKYSRRLQQGNNSSRNTGRDSCIPGQISQPMQYGPKRSSSAQTDISALPEHWKSESQLAGNRCHLGGRCTLPSKFVPSSKISVCPKHFSRISERSSQEARRILLSDINFTSMVPELSRSADHLCQDENRQESGKQSPRYYKGNLLKTPDYALKGITPSVSMNSPGASQWTVNESSFGTQTIITGESWGGKRDDSFDSYKSYSIGGSRYSGLSRHHRSRSVPSIRCAICRQTHHAGIRPSEKPNGKIRGSLPDLRYDCICSRRFCGGGGRTIFPIHGDSSGSTESLLDEADAFIRKSMDSAMLTADDVHLKRSNVRRMSENDIQKDYPHSKQSLPFLPKTAKCLKPGHLAKVISKNGRVVVGRVRYVGPLAVTDKTTGTKQLLIDDLYVGVQLQSKCGDCDGTYEGRKFFECEPQKGLFVPFKKVVMAWTG